MNFTILANDNISAKNQLKNIYLKLNMKPDLMNTMTFDCLDADINQIIDYCQSIPFFEKYKFAIIKNPLFLTGKSNKDYEEFINKIMTYLENSNESTILIFYLVCEDVAKVDDILDKRKKITKFIQEKTKVLKIDKPDLVTLKNIIIKKFNKLNNTIDDDAITYIIERVGDNLSDIKNEVEKISLYKRNEHIRKDDVIDFVTFNLDANIFDLCNMILSKDINKSLVLLDQLLKNGMEPIVLIFNLAEQLRIALLTKNYLAKNYSQKNIASLLKIHPYRIKVASQLNFSTSLIKQNLLRLAKLDYQIKTGKINSYHGVKVFILKI
ncbi:MAG: DNA polymerase III subunit delta [Bacilli bacterium]|jgi:DNA polymerase-3 subunit delta|nr:DNA polymerase III subunit delta [Bacilli bacterium]